MSRFSSRLALIAAMWASYTAAAVGDEDHVVVRCEHLLTGEGPVAEAEPYLRRALTSLADGEDARVMSSALTAKALGAFHLDRMPSHALQQVSARTTEEAGEYRLELSVGGRSMILPVRMTGLQAWQIVALSPSEVDQEIKRSSLLKLLNDQLMEIGVRRRGGLIAGSRPGVYYSQFISVRFLPRLYHYVLGIDVPCQSIYEYTADKERLLVRSGRGWHCRVPILEIWHPRERAVIRPRWRP